MAGGLPHGLRLQRVALSTPIPILPNLSRTSLRVALSTQGAPASLLPVETMRNVHSATTRPLWIGRNRTWINPINLDRRSLRCNYEC